MVARLAAAVVLAMLPTRALAQGNTLDDVRLYQSFFHDSPVAAAPYVQGGVVCEGYDAASRLSLGGQGGAPVIPGAEVQGAVGFSSLDYDNELAEGQSGINDLLLAGRYRVPLQAAQAAVGGWITLPVGDEDLGEGNLDLGFFGAARHRLPQLVVTGVVGVDFLDFATGREASLRGAGGVIYPASERLAVIGELALRSKLAYGLLTGGVDYRLAGTGRVRGFLGLGVDNGAPDLVLAGSFLYPFPAP
ncbi:MAG: hypothetical protein AB1505_02620 [Candidatus Latescibacterota bacterium]